MNIHPLISSYSRHLPLHPSETLNMPLAEVVTTMSNILGRRIPHYMVISPISRGRLNRHAKPLIAGPKMC